MSNPTFAVVGHPNKGKSSIVSTLIRNDQIAVSRQSGTTVVSESFTINIGQATYELIDTPGFQRPRKVLAWLQQSQPSTDKRYQRIKEFLADQQSQQLFKDEIELLTPIVNGAAILYVVDGSRPYSAEYEAEMEILRWTGKPAMALINPIKNGNYVQSWQAALGQYFNVVRVFDAVNADKQQHIELFQAFAVINQSWQQPIDEIINAISQEDRQQHFQSCFIAAQLLQEASAYTLTQKTISKSQALVLQPQLEQRLYTWIRLREQNALDELQKLYRHHHLQRNNTQLLLPNDLFDTNKWYGWGLNKRQLTGVAAITGAAAGGALDVAVAGHSLMLGAIGGGVVGSTAAWFGADKLASSNIKGIPLGGYEAKVGPIGSKNFPYVLLARFLFVFQLIKNRNHANRDAISLGEVGVDKLLQQLNKPQQKKLHLALDRLSRQKTVADLPDILMPLFSLIKN